jgi:hypothetical protein
MKWGVPRRTIGIEVKISDFSLNCRIRHFLAKQPSSKIRASLEGTAGSTSYSRPLALEVGNPYQQAFVLQNMA